MATKFLHSTEDVNFAGKALVVPVVSTANVSQLAVDLLIASLSLQRVGIFDPQYFVPAIGGRDDGKKGATTPLELFGNDETPILVIQQRSPALKSRKQEFIDALLEFIQQSNISSVLFLSGVDLSNRMDSQMLTPTYFIHPPHTPPLSGRLESIHQLPIPPYTSPIPQNPSYEGKTPREIEQDIPFIPGGGLTRRILTSISHPTWSIPTAALLQFVLEGDNTSDARLFAAIAAKVLAVDSLVTHWREPESWNNGLFGAPHDQSLYG